MIQIDKLLSTAIKREAEDIVLTLGAAITIAVVGLWSLRTWRGLRGQGEDAGGRPVDESLFLSYAAALHSALFLVAVIWIGFPILAMPLCAG